MTLSAHAIADYTLAAVVAVLIAAGMPAEGADQPAVPAPSTASGGGVTLHSVKVDLPDRDRMFSGAGSDAINNNCLACHSTGMVLTQPSLSRAAWQAEIDKMRNIYKAPVAAEDVPAIVDYLANLRNAK